MFGGPLLDAPARRRAASKIDKATRRAELDRLMRRHGRRAPSDIVYEADADIKNENRLFYDAVDGQTGCVHGSVADGPRSRPTRTIWGLRDCRCAKLGPCCIDRTGCGRLASRR